MAHVADALIEVLDQPYARLGRGFADAGAGIVDAVGDQRPAIILAGFFNDLSRWPASPFDSEANSALS
jgi:hypothetical protein